MTPASRSVQRTFLTLTLLNALSMSLIWGVNTLFLLDAGLSNAQAFAANAFYTLGMVVFEVPTGVVADTRGRRTSFLLGAATLTVATLIYVLMWQIEASFWGWALASAFIGLGYTFFSGAMEAWLVDALAATGYTGDTAVVFARGQGFEGAGILIGSVGGGFLAQATNLGAPYLLRAALLVVTGVCAFVAMRDLGFSPRRGEKVGTAVRSVLRASIDEGLRRRPVRWVMLTGPFTLGVGLYAFYAAQPYLLELYGDEGAFGIAGIAAGAIAASQMAGALLVPVMLRRFGRRTHALMATTALAAVSLVVVGLTDEFWVAVVFLLLWSFGFIAREPLHQAYINDLISSEQRATVLSFDSLLGSAGGAVLQSPLGRVADVWNYGTSMAVAGVVQLAALPFLVAARRENVPSDVVKP